MNLTYLDHVWPLFLAGVVSASFAVLALRRREAPGAVPFAVLMFGLVVWSVPDGLFQLSDAARWQHFWTKIEYIGIALVPLFWVITALAYTGRGRLLNRRWIAYAAIIPFITIVLAWSFESHTLIYRDFHFFREDHRLSLDITYGPWWWVNAAYSYVLLIWGAGLFLMAASRSFFIYRSQAVALLAAIILPVAGNVLHIFRIGPFGAIDPTPFTFALAGLPLGWAIFRFRLFDLTPVAREAVFEGMEDGVIVLDQNNRVSDLNPSAERILGKGGRQVVGRSVTEAIGVWLGNPGDDLPSARERRDVFLPVDGEERIYEMDVSALTERDGRAVGKILVLKDVTRWRAMGEELSSARAEIDELAELLPMCAWCRQVRSDEGYWEGLESYITKQARTHFTHGICPNCEAKLAKKAGVAVEDGSTEVEGDPSGVEPRSQEDAEGSGESEPWPGPRDPGIEKF